MIRFADETSNPQTQKAYRFVTEMGWVPADSPSATDFFAAEIQLVTWNIDAEGDHLEERFVRIMSHLRKKVLKATPPPPSCILLQEVHQNILPVMLRHRWVREHFLITPITTEGWTAPHGLVTLVTKTVPVSTVFSIELPRSTEGRQGLFVDVHLSGPRVKASDGQKSTRIRTLRIANTHLEPEPSGARVRAKQLDTIARLLNVPNTDAHICGGSMCSVHDSEKATPASSGFADAYKGSKADGMTWGLQPRSQVLPGRLDKLLYFPTEQVKIQSPKRVGLRLTLKGGCYVSDHCGLVTTVKVLKDH